MAVSVAVFKRYLPYTGVPLAPRQTPPVVLAMQDAYLVGLGHQGKLWSLRAERIEIAQNRSSTSIAGITDGRIYEQARVALKVKAGRADYDAYTRGLTLAGGIEVRGPDGQRVIAEGATWNSFDSTLRSSGRVSYDSKLSKVTADALRFDLRRRQLEMWNVHVRLHVDEAAEIFGKEVGRVAN